MYVFNKLGAYVIEFVYSFILFLRFMGHLYCSIVHMLIGRLSLSWLNIVRTIYYSGARLAIPLMLISTVLGISMVMKVNSILTPYNLQRDGRLIAQNILTHDLVPFLIGVLLCIQSALNLINVKNEEDFNLPQQVLVNHILPVLIGINIAGGLLYAYSVAAFFIGIYVTYQYFLYTNLYVPMIRILTAITLYDVVYSILKTSLYCTIVSLTIGYYHYDMVVRNLSLRLTVSRIMTRGFLWLALIGVYWN
ncbi:ABC transporter permease [Legionella gratiana]|uniref:ABC transporter permease n=2 Tax=Legionella gratiana TaxID=45066 RepID=A0A378JBL1_9GAMM|nr:hypothetical protein [Legionella gratiana]KTD06375.1 ABC transporter permease [Legionella gratiana]STX45193.1 ABC transporter permease [Legionella gratiana]